MRFATAAAVLMLLSAPALAQAPAKQPPAKRATKPAPKPAAKPAAKSDPIAQSYAALPEAERIAIQTDLIWTGDYNGLASADFGARAIAGVKAFQKRNGTKETGVLNPKERQQLGAAARKRREAVGWRLLDDGTTGTRIGIPSRLVPQHSVVIGGSRWTSARGEVQIDTFRTAAPGTTLASVYEAQRKVAERKITYNVARPDFFVVSGLQGLKKLYVRGQAKDGQVRGFSIQYDQSMEGTLDAVVIAMSSSFQAFPVGAIAAAPPPRRKVEYGSGVLVSSDGHALTTRDLIDGCQTFNLAGYGPADLVAQDKSSGLALLRIYGVRDLKIATLATGESGPNVTLIGVADPERQNGGGSVSLASARSAPAAAGQHPTIEPAPALGFAGAAAVDRAGRLIGVADVRTLAVAGPSPATSASASLIPAAAIRNFLAEHKVTPSGDAASVDAAKASVVRVICVRK
jgi:peptidoglycan hydrolase-like protein with peptidoglycan-binding domain